MAWYTNMTAVSLFWNTNIADVTSCENAPYCTGLRKYLVIEEPARSKVQSISCYLQFHNYCFTVIMYTVFLTRHSPPTEEKKTEKFNLKLMGKETTAWSLVGLLVGNHEHIFISHCSTS